jgi:hypothetical protein
MMNKYQPDFQSLRNIRDNALLLSIANEYISENVFLRKIGSEIKKNLSDLRNDIIALKKQFPGKFAQEVNTEYILTSFESTAQDMLSGNSDIKKNCASGKLGMALSADIRRINEAIEEIWFQVKGSDVKYTVSDSISVFWGRLNILSGLTALFSSVVKVLFIIIILFIAGFSYLYFTMEKEGSILKANREIVSFIEQKKARLNELEKEKVEAQKSIKTYESNKLLRKDKIALIDIETKVQEFNQEIHLIEGQLDASRRTIEKNNEKLKKIREKSFLDRLLKE